MCKKEVLGHQIPLHAWQLSSVALHASPGKHVASVSQSCQQHIPGGSVVVVVVVAGAHCFSQPATHAANTAGLVGQSAMHTDKEPPGQSSGAGEGDGGIGAGVVVTVQSASQTPMQASKAAPVTTAQAALQADMEPPGHWLGDGLGGEGDGEGDGAGGEGLGEGTGTGAGQFVSTAFAANCLT